MNVLADFRKIRLFVFDMDGVLTDGTVLVLDDGQQVRRMNIKDGYALQLAIKKGYKVLVISGGTSEGVIIRLNKLGVQDIFMNALNKKEVLINYVQQLGMNWDEVLYMGDDIPDLEVMKMTGLACCPADAVPEVRDISQYISANTGGEGCVRDVIEKVLRLNGHWNHDTNVPSN